MTLTYKDGDKLYVVVRNDLLPGEQLAQAIHAKDEFAMKHPEINNVWWHQSNYICVLQVENEDYLRALESRASVANIKCAYFLEPDYNHEMTALALEPGVASKELCKNLSLALK